MSTQQLAFDVLARDRASSTFDRVGRSAGSSSTMLHKFGTAAKYAGIALAGGVALAARGALELAKGAAEDEKATKALALQMHNSADATRGQISATEDWITAQGKALGISDDELRPALSRMVAVTHDVASARRQVALAENVAAGTGKSLSTVTTALAKAQLGSLSGLSRLGVQTKNAAGDTLTLQQVTRKLADTYSGQATKAANTASGQYGRLQVILSETGEAIGYKLLPYAADLADFLLDEGVPALSSFSDWLQTTGGDAADQAVTFGRDLLPVVKKTGAEFLELAAAVVETAGPIAHDLLPVVKDLAGVAAGLAGWLADLPGPVKKLGAEAGIAALIIPRFTSAVDTSVSSVRTWGRELGNAETRSKAATSAVQKLGGVARNAAGAAGVLALSKASGETNKKLKTLELAAGGAATGFAIGGPLGAAIGGISGGLLGIVDSVKDVNQGWDVAKPKAKDYASTLDTVTGAATKATRAMVLQGLQEAGLVSTANQLGISTRDMIDAALGNANAATRIGKAWQSTGTVLDGLQNTKISTWLSEQGWQIDQNRADIVANRDALKSWDNALKGVRPKVQVKLETLGYELTRKQFRDLDKQADLTDRERKIIIREIGIDPTRSQLRKLGVDLSKVGDAKPNLDPFVTGMLNDLSKAERKAIFGTASINKIIRQTTGDARPDLSPFQRQLVDDLSAAKTPAKTGGHGVGSAVTSGTMAGVSGLGALLASSLSASVRQGINAAKAEAKIKSPSAVMRDEVGVMLARGVVDGVRSQDSAVRNSGRGVMFALVAGVADGQKGLQHQLDQATNTLSSWRDKLKSLMSDRRSFVSGFQAFGSSVFSGDITGRTITGADGQETTAPLNIGDLLGYSMGQANQADQVKDDVKRLISLGLSDSLLKQLQASPGGAERIHVLAGGTRQQIATFNDLNKQTVSDYHTAGVAGAGVLFNQDIRNTRRHVEVAIDEVKLAKALVKAWEARDKKRKAREDKHDHQMERIAKATEEGVKATRNVGPDVSATINRTGVRAGHRK